MSVVIEIDAVSQPVLAQSVDIAATANGQDTLRMTVPSLEASYRPALDNEVSVVVDTETLFGGIITSIRERGFNDDPTVGILNEVDATDFNRLASERYATEDFPSQSVKARLTTLVTNYLSDAGVSLHGSQADGPTLEAVSYRLVKVEDILNEIATLAEGFVWEIDYAKVLRMYAPGSISAPFDITIPATTWFGDLTVEPTRNDYANRVIVDTGATAEPVIAEDTDEQESVGRIIEVVIGAPDNTTGDQAEALATAYLAQRIVTLKKVTYKTRTPGLAPGQTQTITVSQRNINNTFLITDVRTSYEGKAGWLYRVTAIEGLVYQTGWRETFKRWGGGGAVSAGGLGGGVSFQRFAYFLGGSGADFYDSPTPTWIDASPIQVQINTVARGTTSATITARLKALDSGVSVQARLYDVTDSVACTGTSTEVESTDWTTVTWTVTLTAGSHYYKLQLLPSAANKGVGAVAYLE